MQKTHLLVLSALFVLLVGGAIAMPALLGDAEIPVTRWNADQEQDVPEAVDPAQVATTEGDAVLERSSATPVGNQAIPADDRVEVLMRGRVIDKFQRPVAGATVWLDFGRGGRGGGPGGGFGGQGGRQRRVPDPVTTDQEGRFAFQGQTFRNLRVSLQVAHEKHAPGTFDKDVGSVAAEVELGDLVLQNGGEIRGRVTDLEGNGIPAAEVRLSAENGNALRFVRDRERILPSLQTDTNGYFRRLHVAAGDWSVTATAKAHTEGRSATFAVEEDQAVDVEDIRLGPGYEITGTVRDARGQPIAKASVAMQAERTRGNGGTPGGGGQGGQNGGPGGGGRMAFAGMGRDHRTTTDERGNFFLEHLPGVAMRVSVDADGFLDLRVDGVDAKLGQPLQLTMQDGLRIDGIVRDSDGTPVTRFAFRAVRLRGLPQPGDDTGGNPMDFGAGRGGPMRQGQDRQGGGGGGDRQGDLDRPERHADGRFRATGLQEGVYEVHVQSPDHARHQSPEIELRAGAPVAELQIALDGGFFVAGAVVDHTGNPVANARVTMRAPSPFETMGPGRMRGRGNNGNGGAPAPGNGGRTTDAAAGQAPDFAAAGREMQRAANGVQLQFETNTDADGAFVIKHAARGTYRLQAEARGHAMARTEPFELVADRSAQELRLGALATLAGTVRGLAENEVGEARVGAVPIDGGNVNFGGMGRGRGGQGGGQGPFAQATVAADGSYRFDDLTPGSYLVRCWVGSPQELMRELMPQFLSGQLTADVVVQAGQETRFDLQVTRPQLGKVAGNVMVNGAPANGYAVELARLDDNNQTQGGGMGMGRGGRGGGRNQATVASTGRFEIDKVAVGRYRLRVQTDRRGGTLHEEEVFVALDRTTEVAISLQTHSLQGAVSATDASAAELNGRVQLLPGLAELPENLNNWTRENTSYDARLQGGAFKFEAIKPGSYLLVLSVRGRERTVQPVVVGGDQQVSLTAGAKSPEPAPGTGAQPGANAPRGGGGGGNPRGGPGGGGGRGGR